MSDINNFTATGRLTRDPQTRFLAGDKCVASFALAIGKQYTTGTGEKRDETLFLDCDAWGRLAEIIGQYCTKGKQVAIVGSLKMDTWEKDGQKREKIKCVVDQLTMIGDSKRSDAPAQKASSDGLVIRPKEKTPTTPRDSGNDEPPF
jgi:single-strand DNA-binding protein